MLPLINKKEIQRRFMLHLDPVLLLAIGLLLLVSLVLLYSASDGNWVRVFSQFINIVAACTAMWIVANMPLHYLMRSAVPIYILGLVLLVCVACSEKSVTVRGVG